MLHESDSRDKYMSKEYCIQALRTTAIVVSVKSSVKQKQIFEPENYLHKYNMVTTKKHISVSLWPSAYMFEVQDPCDIQDGVFCDIGQQLPAVNHSHKDLPFGIRGVLHPPLSLSSSNGEDYV